MGGGGGIVRLGWVNREGRKVVGVEGVEEKEPMISIIR